MFIAAQQFIEKNINLFESDAAKFFVALWESEMSCEEAMDVLDAFSDAHIEYEGAHQEALQRVVDHQIKKFARSNVDLSAMPLRDFMFGYVYNFIGFGVNEVEEFILQNASMWDDEVQIFFRGDMPVIEKRLS